MTVSEKLFLLILAMDSYNRGYAAGLEREVGKGLGRRPSLDIHAACSILHCGLEADIRSSAVYSPGGQFFPSGNGTLLAFGHPVILLRCGPSKETLAAALRSWRQLIHSFAGKACFTHMRLNVPFW